MAHNDNIKKLNEFLQGTNQAIVADILKDIATDLLNGNGDVELKKNVNNELIVEIDHDDFLMKLKLYE